MIIIPELETVLLQPPRTGTSSLKDAVLEKYPRAFMLYRHMERAGIPVGYEQWTVVSQMRDPLTRMQSLFQYMTNPEQRADTDPEWLDSVRADTENGFEWWLLHGRYIFANPSPSHGKSYRPRYNVAYPFREQIKSQRLWAQFADKVIDFDALAIEALEVLGVSIHHRGASTDVDINWSANAIDHMWKYHGWDMVEYGYVPPQASEHDACVLDSQQ